MAVIVVGSIAYQLIQIDEPVKGISTDLEAQIEGQNLTITHMGGRTLESYHVKIYVGIGSSINRSFTIPDGFPVTKRTWSIGEQWETNVSGEITDATNWNLRLFVQVVDTKANRILLDQVLIGGLEDKSFPDVGFEVGSMEFSDNNPDSGDALYINVTVVNYGMVDVTNIEVRFFDEKDLIGTNKTITNLPRNGQPNDNATVCLNWTTSYLGRHMISAKIVPKSDETNLANNYISQKLTIGFGVNLDFIKPNLVVKGFTISKDTPKSKEAVVLTATIANTAKITATGFTMSWGDLFQGTNTTTNTTVYVGNVTYVKDVELRYEWVPQKGGFHTIWVNIDIVLPSGEDPKADADPEIDNDYAELEIDVLPKILLVDDDLAGKDSSRDTVTYMREALKGIGVSPDVVLVGAGDGPQYTGTGITLDDYDVVIWMTGYETTNTLTTAGNTADVKNLQKYLDHNGSLWLIGQDILNDLIDNGGAVGSNFISDYLQVGGQTLDVDLTDHLRGNDNCDVTAGLSFNTSIPSDMSASPDLILPINNSISAMDNATNGNLSLLHNRSNYQVAFFAFDFSHIQGHSDRSILAYKILSWFNATVSFEGDDLSVSEVIITPSNPYFKQEVTINAVIRNNGMNDLDQVRLVFRDLYFGIETVIPGDTRDTAGGIAAPDNPMTLNISAHGGYNVTLKHWVPDQIGIHQIKVIVDPNDVIQEFDETNNEFVSDLTPTDVYVDTITLVVDDDQTASGVENTTASVIETMDQLNYRYELHNVSAVGDDGPDLDTMTSYNNIIWVLGNESTDGTTFTSADQANIDSFLNGYQGNLLVIGQNLLEDDSVRNNVTFRRDLLGINGYTRNIATPTTLMGIKGNNITHGARYSTSPTFGNEADAITPYTAVETLFLNGAGSNFATAFHNTAGVNYKVVVMTFEYSFINDVEDRKELNYLIFHWFQQSDYRIELRVTTEDLFFGRDDGPPQPFDAVNPVLGQSYLLQAKIWNVGNTPAGAVIRFLDGATVINSASVYVPASTISEDGDLQLGTELAEIIWTPLYAGNRVITVKVDPDKNIPVSNDPKITSAEIMKKNNNVSRPIEVYFFYDDMESGPNNWVHEATILHINGEQPIEYFDTLRPIETNVVNDWNNMSGNWQQLYDQGHSLPSSFGAREPLDTNVTPIYLRVGICIEDSAQIGNHDPDIIRLKAAWNFTNATFSEGDELTIYKIDKNLENLYENEHPGNGTFEMYPFENMTKYLRNENQTYFDNVGGQTLAECLSGATADLKDSWDTPGIYPSLVVITSAKQFIGSTIEDMLDDSRQNGIPVYMVGVGDQVREDLMYDIAMVSNGGLYFHAKDGDEINYALEVIGEIIGSGGSRSIDGGDTPTTGSRDMDGRTAPPGGKNFKLYNPVGTDKWAQGISRNLTYYCNDKTYGMAACKSPKIYFDPGTGVWSEIASISVTQSPFDWTSDSASSDPADACWQYNWTIPKVTCKTCRIKVEINAGAVSAQSMSFEIFDSGLPLGQRQAEVSNITTEEFNLANYESAKLAFWHKYDLLTTENGGVILVGNSSQKDTGYSYHYVTPKKTYPGNLRLDKDIRDDDGTSIVFAYNSKSAGQTFNWVYDEVDLTPFISASTPWIRVRFSLYVWGYGNGGGWWLDDVQVKVTRSDSTPITSAVADQWEYYEWDSMVDPAEYQPYSGTHMWWNHDPTNNHDVSSGIDSSLTSKSIDLTNAMDAHISAYFKFNFDDDAGRPPDGFRTELSSNNGVTWRPINLGVRSSWGVSGDWSTDGKSPDGRQAYTGIQDNGLDSNTPVWIEAGTLWRLNTNLSGWSGSVIKIRFRIVTNLDATHHQSATSFRGFAVDNIIIHGNTTTSNAPMPPPQDPSADGVKDFTQHGGFFDPVRDGDEDMSISTDPNNEKAAVWKDR